MIDKILSVSVLFALSFGELSGQDLKKIKRKLTPSNSVETYYVLKSDKGTKHGDYALSNNDGIMIAEGRFDHGEKVGSWEYCRENSEEINRYTFNHDDNKLLYYAIAERRNKLGYQLKELRFEDVEPPENLISMMDNLYGFQKDFQEAFRAEYGQPDTRHKGIIYISMLCSKSQEITNFEIISRLGDYDRKHLLKVLKRTLLDFKNERVLFIDLEGNPTSGELVAPLVFL